jgi:RNA-directed DNA polymerase
MFPAAVLSQGVAWDRCDACRRRGRGGAVVVLRAWESHVHGEGRQRVSQGEEAMSEDAPVNIGAATVWPDPDSAYFAVRRMQTKLHRWAIEEPDRRFGDLYNLIYDPAFLVHAWERVRSNAGSGTPGIDCATVAMVETRIGVDVFLGHIRHSLKSGEFAPVEVRRVRIPKKTPGEFRRLGIPTEAA